MADRSTWAELDDWMGTAAASLVLLIDAKVPAYWHRILDGPGMWRWQRDDPAEPSGIAVNGRDDAAMVVPFHGWPARMGPTVMAYGRDENDKLVSVTLPVVADSDEIAGALRVLATIEPALDPTDRWLEASDG
jgi:hypothetical protein